MSTQDDLTRKIKHFNKMLCTFWERWRSEYLLDLRDAHRYYQQLHNVSEPIVEVDVVIIHDEDNPEDNGS